MKVQSSSRRKIGLSFLLLSCFVFFSFCGKKENLYYLDSKLTDGKENALNIIINDSKINLEDYQFRLNKSKEAELIQSESLPFGEWVAFESNYERIELLSALPGSYTINLEIKNKEFITAPTETEETTEATQAIEETEETEETQNFLVQKSFSWEYYTVEGEAQIAYDSDGNEIQVDGAQQIEKEGGRKVQKEEEGEGEGQEVEEETKEGGPKEQKTIYWVDSNEFELFVSPKEGQTLPKEKEYEIFLEGSAQGENANTWIPYTEGTPINISVSPEDGNKWILMDFREKGSEEALEGFSYAMPIFLNPRAELSGGGLGLRVIVAPFAGTVTTGLISIVGCQETYDFVKYDPDGYICIPSDGATKATVTHFFNDGQSLDLSVDF